MGNLVYSNSIYGYYANTIANELNLHDGETKTLPMNVSFRAKDVEGRTVLFVTMKEQNAESKNPDPDDNQAFTETPNQQQITINKAYLAKKAASL